MGYSCWWKLTNYSPSQLLMFTSILSFEMSTSPSKHKPAIKTPNKYLIPRSVCVMAQYITLLEHHLYFTCTSVKWNSRLIPEVHLIHQSSKFLCHCCLESYLLALFCSCSTLDGHCGWDYYAYLYFYPHLKDILFICALCTSELLNVPGCSVSDWAQSF